MKDVEKVFEDLITELKNTSGVVGLFLGGSRGKGFQSEESDYDLYVLVKDSELKRLKRIYPRVHHPKIELMVKSVREFHSYASWNSPAAFERYTFAHVQPIFDKSGRLSKMLIEKSEIPKKEAREFTVNSLDAYVNAGYRSIKYFKAGNNLGARLEAIESVRYMLDTLFAIERRPRPYYGYLENEIKRFPLKIAPRNLIKIVYKLIEKPDLKIQRDTLKQMEQIAREKDLGFVFDLWSKHMF